MFKVCSWNIRGLNNPSKRNAVRLVVSSLRSTVVCFQDTKVNHVSGSFLRSCCGSFFDKRMLVEASGASGGLLTCWNSRTFDCSEVFVRHFTLTLHLRHRASGLDFYISNVYGPPRWDGKAEFCDELRQLKDLCVGRWVVCGDFNFTRSQSERSGKEWSRRATLMFNELIRDLALIDLPLKNSRFTWSNMQHNPTLAKLDRFLVSTVWDSSFPCSGVEALPRVTSDHCPILLTTAGRNRGPCKIFRFEEVWLKQDGLREHLAIWWNEVPTEHSAILTFTAKLRHCRNRLKNWRFSHFHSIRKEKERMMLEIQGLDLLEERQELPQSMIEKREGLKRSLGLIIDEEEILWKARAKHRWMKEGDRNTKFFHAFANGRKRANEIGVIEDGGRVLREDGEKIDYFFRKFTELFAPRASGPANFGDWSALFRSRRVSEEDRANLAAPFSHEELRKAVFQLGGDKAPGPDGFPLCFYQAFWDILKEDIHKIFQELHNGACCTGPIDYSFVCLIPKKEGPTRANDFRPVCLINGIQKIISKVLANRLAPVLHPLISQCQSAFLKGRSISDAFATAAEIVGWTSRAKIEGVGVKVDFEKAYDSINWSFLGKILEWWGFSAQWCGWIRQCVENAKVAVLVNGVATKWIKSKRGVRQGDPLSSYLFLLVAECLARMTEEAGSNNLIKGVGPAEHCRFSLIQFADDTLFFTEARKRYLRNLKFIWQLYEWSSGLKVNYTKTELFYSGSRANKGASLANILGCRHGSLPLNYLGMPLSDRKLTKDDWFGVIDKLGRRIDGWQAKLLSRGGRLTLVNAVLANVPLYLFSVFKAPTWVINRIESLRRDFFWFGDAQRNGWGRLVAWKRVCRSKVEGGLGVLDLGLMNDALLVKWWWRFFRSADAPWGKLVRALYYSKRKPLGEGCAFRPASQWWRGVVKLKEIFRGGSAYSLGNGNSIRFWTDRWCCETSLQYRFPELYAAVARKTVLVGDCFGSGGWR